jgi:hypothetical protein
MPHSVPTSPMRSHLNPKKDEFFTSSSSLPLSIRPSSPRLLQIPHPCAAGIFEYSFVTNLFGDLNEVQFINPVFHYFGNAMPVEQVLLFDINPIAAKVEEEADDDFLYAQLANIICQNDDDDDLMEIDDDEEEEFSADFGDAPNLSDNEEEEDADDANDQSIEEQEERHIISFYESRPLALEELPVLDEDKDFQNRPLSRHEKQRYDKFDQDVLEYGLTLATATPAKTPDLDPFDFEMSGLLTPTSIVPPASICKMTLSIQRA